MRDDLQREVEAFLRANLRQLPVSAVRERARRRNEGIPREGPAEGGVSGERMIPATRTGPRGRTKGGSG